MYYSMIFIRCYYLVSIEIVALRFFEKKLRFFVLQKCCSGPLEHDHFATLKTQMTFLGVITCLGLIQMLGYFN